MSEFDEYIRQGELGPKQKAEAWKTAIGLQDVDGLKPSTYLLDTAKRHIEGDITIEQVKGLIDSYYKSKEGRFSQSINESIVACFRVFSNLRASFGLTISQKKNGCSTVLLCYITRSRILPRHWIMISLKNGSSIMRKCLRTNPFLTLRLLLRGYGKYIHLAKVIPVLRRSS